MAAAAPPSPPPPVVAHWRPRRRGPGAVIPALATLAVILGVIGITLWQLHPNLLLSNTPTTGGDTGAHFVMPAFLKTYLLPHGHLTGWDPGWFDGFPIYTYYFILPDLFAALGAYVIPYGIAFKLATISGSVALPICAWALGRLFGMKRPGPAVLAAATLPFLFDYSFTIYGGNLFSTLAGEYAYSLSIALGLVFLGLFARGVRTGRNRGWAALVLAACIAAHIIPAMFVLVGAAILTAFEILPEQLRPDDAMAGWRSGIRDVGEVAMGTWRRLWWAASTVVLGLLLSGWWLVPFGLRQPYTTTMGYANVTGYANLLFPVADRWAIFLAAAAVVAGFALRSRLVICFTLLALFAAVVLVFDPIGSLYNVRVLPLWFLSVYLLAAWVVAAALTFAARAWRRHRTAIWVAAVHHARGVLARVPGRPAPGRWGAGAVAGPLVALLLAAAVVVPPFVVSANLLPVTVGANQVSAWAAWNYSGYEGKPAYPEYRAVITTMAKVGARFGCGRAMWEYNADLNRFGTPMALMLLPYWTGDCIDSMEGLVFESSATTPYHFLNQAELSVGPSEPVVGLNYSPGINIPLGVSHLQQLGVKYYMASSPATIAAAKLDPSLRLVATTGPWKSLYGAQEITTTWDVFEVSNSAVVEPLANDPAVLTDVKPAQPSWLPVSEAWYNDPARWAVELAAGGPSEWPRITASTTDPPQKAVAPTTVSDIAQTSDTISFHVTRIGTPVVVKTSYFPNWHAEGANGPWRVTPNLMVVVPTSHDVTLTYDSTQANELGELATGVALLLVVIPGTVIALRRRRQRAALR